MSLLNDALKSQDANLVQALLESETFSLNDQDPETGYTALMYALDSGNEEVALELIRRGANVELASVNGETPLMAACVNCHSAVEEIVFRVRDLDVMDSDGVTAMSLAVPFSSLEIVQLLLRSGASLLTTVEGLSVFHLALLKGRLDTAEYLLTEFEVFSVSHRDADGNQPMNTAACGGYPNVIEWLISRGAPFDEPGYQGETPLMTAARNGHILVAQTLLLWGADPHRLDEDGCTARSLAAEEEGHEGVVALLDAWRSVQALWVVRFAGEVRHVAPRSEFKRLPYDMNRMLGKFLV
jgi:ankyrin repeat protein